MLCLFRFGFGHKKPGENIKIKNLYDILKFGFIFGLWYKKPGKIK